MKAGWISDKIMKWFFIAVVLCIVLLAVSPFIIDADTWNESSEEAAEFTEKLRLK